MITKNTYLDEVNSCAREITAVHKKAWITVEEKKKEKYDNMFKHICEYNYYGIKQSIKGIL